MDNKLEATAKDIILRFLKREYGEADAETVFADLKKVIIIHTTTEDDEGEEHEIQAALDLVGHKMNLYYDQCTVASSYYRGPCDMAENCLKCLDVDAIKATAKVFGEITDMVNDTDWVVISGEFDGYDSHGHPKNCTIEYENASPAGEDLVETVYFDGTIKGFVNGVRCNANNYDADEHADIYIESRGKRGVPSSIRVLIEDAVEIGEMLNDFAETLEARLECKSGDGQEVAKMNVKNSKEGKGEI